MDFFCACVKSTLSTGIFVTVVGKVLARFNVFAWYKSTALGERKPAGLLRCARVVLLGPQASVLLVLARVGYDIAEVL